MAKKEKTYDNALEELENLMVEIETKDLSINELMSKVKIATELIQFCKKQLTEIDKEVQNVLDKLDN